MLYSQQTLTAKGQAMTNATITETIPIYTDDHGRMRVSGTRVLLDLIVYAYHQGHTPEHIVQMYPTLTSDQVYLAIGYYLRHRDTVDRYIRHLDDDAERLRQDDDATPSTQPTRAALLDRLQARQDNCG